jgi:hypothetical protein
LRAAGNDVEEIEYASIGHIGIISAMAKPLRWRADVLGDVTRFLSSRLKLDPVPERKVCDLDPQRAKAAVR